MTFGSLLLLSHCWSAFHVSWTLSCPKFKFNFSCISQNLTLLTLVKDEIWIVWYHQFSFSRTLFIYYLVPITFIAEIKARQFSTRTGSKYTQAYRYCSRFGLKYSKLYFFIACSKQHFNTVADILSSLLKWELQVLGWVAHGKTYATARLLHSSFMTRSNHT